MKVKELNISLDELRVLEKAPHKWIDIEGGAICFFCYPDGKSHYLAYQEQCIQCDDEAISRFWETVGTHPVVRWMDTVDVNIQDFAQINWEKV